MNDETISSEQSVYELSQLRIRVAELEHDLSKELADKEDLRERESRFRRIVENISDVIFEVDHQGEVLYFSPIGKDIWGYDQEDIIGKNFIEFIHPDDQDMLFKRFLELRTGMEKPLSYRIKDKAGNFKWVRTRTKPRIENGIFSGASGTLIDIVDQKRAEEALRESEQMYRLLASRMTDAVWISDLNFNTTYVSPSVELMLGVPPEERMRIPFKDQVTPETYMLVIEQLTMELIREENGQADPDRTVTMEMEYYHRNGSTIWLENIISAIRNSDGLLIGLQGVARNISKRKKMEAELRESEERFRLVTENARDTIWTMDMNLQHTYVSPYVNHLLGYTQEEFLTLSLNKSLTPSSLEICMHAFAKELEIEKRDDKDLLRSRTIEVEQICRNGNIVPSEIKVTFMRNAAGQATGLLGYTRDISDRKRAEEAKAKLENQLSQAQKMQAIGTFAGGIAHDFNNILGIIVGYTEMAMNENQREKQEQYLQQTLEGTERAKDVIKQLLTFSSRKDNHEKKPLDLKILLKETVKFIRASIPATIEISQHLTKNSCNILADPTQINQIIMNLCSNATYAMKRTGGILKIELSNVEMAQGDIPIHHDLKPGHYARLTVSDTGHGIDPDMQQYIFDPFFTTKSKEEGTGLGLSVVYGIVKTHNGFINVYSQTDKGATFNIYLPLIIHAETMKMDRDIPIAGGTERILFVDDEPALADIGTRMLSSLGYQVTGVTSSVEALHLFNNEPQQFDLVITDMTLPKMTGTVLSRKILKIRPDVPIILCSGVRDSETEEKVKSLGIRDYLAKPLTRKDLSQVIRKTLDENIKNI